MHYRENTLHSLTQKNSFLGKGLSEKVIDDGMNPDFPFKNKNLWHSDIDKSDEYNLSKITWHLLKAGRIDDIKQNLLKSGQQWRWVAFFKENSAITSETVKENAWQIGNNSNMNDYDKAIYAINISGNVQEALKVCNSWTERLWVYLKVFCDIKEQTYIKEHVTQFDVYGFDVDEDELELNLNEPEVLELGNEFWKQELANLNETVDHAISGKSCDAYGCLVNGLIQNNTKIIIESLTAIKNPRLSTHIGLIDDNIFKQFVDSYSKELLSTVEANKVHSNRIISNFIESKLSVYWKALPFYISRILDEETILNYMGKLLSFCQNTDERDELIESGLRYGIDVHLSIARVVKDIRTSPAASDDEKLNAVDLLLLHTAQRAEAIKQINALARTFILTENNAFLTKLLNKIPDDTIELLENQDSVSEMYEYLSLAMYKSAVESFEDYSEMRARKDATNNDLKIYVKKFGKIVNDMIGKSIGGWMDPGNDEFDSQRIVEMNTIRKLVLPKFTTLYLNCLVDTKQYDAALQQATYLVNVRRGLENCFTGEDWTLINKVMQKVIVSQYEQQ